jgi:hypothetical protein
MPPAEPRGPALIGARKRVALGLLGAALLASTLRASPAQAQAQTSAEQKRKQIQEQLGLPRTPPGKPASPASPPPAASEPAAPEAPAALPSADAATPGAPAASAAPKPPVFPGAVHGQLLTSCKSCHTAGGSAANTKLLLGRGPRADFASVRAFVDLRRPAQSPLLAKGAGVAHGGGALVARGTRPYRQLLAWITTGALFEAPSEATVAVAPASAASASPARPPRRSVPPAPPISAPSVAVAAPSAPPAAPAAAASPVPVAAPAPASPAAPAPASPAAPAPASPAAPAGPTFAAGVHALLLSGCQSCHSSAGSAAATRLLFTGNAESDLASVHGSLDPAAPTRAETSPLVRKGAGIEHGGGVVFAAGSPGHATLVAWIAAGAPATQAPAASAKVAADVPPVSVVASPVSPAAASAPASPPAPPPPSAPAHAHPGLGLPLGFQLNGRFDLAYERRGMGRDTSFADGTSALRSHHQFLFLSRPADATSPVGLTVELLHLQIWEATFAHRFTALPVSLTARAGKLLVPFGAEPLFHQLYGGLVGFDQKVVPAVWPQEGAAEQLVARLGPVALSSDLFFVRGHRLKAPDAVLSLQSDFSPADDLRPAFGHRLGAAWRSLSAWHSLYVNPLGHGRTLVMQALDLSSWRWRGVPVLGRFSGGLGVLRADVSGGGPGADYYHLATYGQVRFHPTDWLYAQYRQGLRTFNNRRGVYLDETRLEANDASSHSLGLVGRRRMLSAGLHYVWNLEKAAEVDDDFLRAVVTLEL